MILPREVSHRVTGDESGPPQNTFEITGCQAEFERVDPQTTRGFSHVTVSCVTVTVPCVTRSAGTRHDSPSARDSRGRAPVMSPPSTGSEGPVIHAASLEASTAIAAAVGKRRP
jgi:hypothetical protein